jgi:hypothetical protein
MGARRRHSRAAGSLSVLSITKNQRLGQCCSYVAQADSGPTWRTPRYLVDVERLAVRRENRVRAGFVVVAALLLTAAASHAGAAAPDVRCATPGEWPHTTDAAWTVRVIRAGRFRRIGCTGSAFVIDTGGIGPSGHDLYVWALTTHRLYLWADMRRERIGGVTVFANRLRAAWRAGHRSVWVEAGPTTQKLLPLVRLRRLIRASITTR